MRRARSDGLALSAAAEPFGDRPIGSDLASSVLRYSGCSIRVCATHADDLAWLLQFLHPHFEPTDLERHDFEVSLIVDPERFDAMHRQGAAGGNALLFVLDSRLVEGVPWRSTGASRVAFDPRQEVFYESAGSRVRILARSRRAPIRVAFMRAVREYVMVHGPGANSLLLHAAAFHFGESAFVLAGPKRAGKTTLLLHALGMQNTRYLANDRLLVSLDGERVHARGIPSLVSIRAGSARFHAALRARLGGRPRMSVTPAELTALMSVESVNAARARALLFPLVTGSPGGIRLRPLSHREAVERLGASIFASRHAQARSILVPQPSPPRVQGAEALRRLCERTASALACYECSLGLDAGAGAPTRLEALCREVDGLAPPGGVD